MVDEAKKVSIATFAGGCFWCLQPPFESLRGVYYTKAGYTGGEEKNPNYKSVSSGRSGHREAVQVFYNPDLISYESLLEVFWKNIDPEDPQGQFCDKGSQYQTAIFYGTEEEKRLAEASKQQLAELGKFSRIETEILPASHFYQAEEEHQDYHKKNPFEFMSYHEGSGRAARLRKIWEGPIR